MADRRETREGGVVELQQITLDPSRGSGTGNDLSPQGPELGLLPRESSVNSAPSLRTVSQGTLASKRLAVPSIGRKQRSASIDVQFSGSFGQRDIDVPPSPVHQPVHQSHPSLRRSGATRVTIEDKVLATTFHPPEDAVREWRYRREAQTVHSESLRRLAGWSSLNAADSQRQSIISRESNAPSAENLKTLRWVLAVVAGAACGVLGWVSKRATDTLSDVRLMNALQGETGELGSIIAVSILMASASAVVTLVEPDVSGGCLAEVTGFLNGIDVRVLLRPTTVLALLCGSVLASASGLVVGTDCPIIMASASLSVCLAQGHLPGCKLRSQLLRAFRDDESAREFVSIGTAAGAAVVFGAPAAGTVFVLEEGGRKWSSQFVWKCLVAAVVSTSVFSVLETGDFSMRVKGVLRLAPGLQSSEPVPPVKWWELFVVAVLSAFLGVIAAGFSHLSLRREELGKYMRNRFGRWMAGRPPRGWKALPSSAVSFREAKQGLVVLMTPYGCCPVRAGGGYLGTVVERKGAGVIMEWHPPDRGGPPEDLFIDAGDSTSSRRRGAPRTREPKEWWDGDGMPRTDKGRAAEPTLKGWKRYRRMCDNVEECERKFGEHPLLTFHRDVEGVFCGRDGQVLQLRDDGLGRTEVRLDFSHMVGPATDAVPRQRFWVPWEATEEPRAQDLRPPAPLGPVPR
eukprot:Hpha_TRINITY_DN8209_c0_g2::TRINITY_DN8209_c0_g2_i1::g.112036::m.112036/K05016/CLCN7; chloride channel 7